MNQTKNLEEYAASLGLVLDAAQQEQLSTLIKRILDCLADPPRAHAVFILAEGPLLTTISLGSSNEEALMLLHAANSMACSPSPDNQNTFVQ